MNRFCFVPTPDRVETPTNNDKNNYGYFQFRVDYPTGATPFVLLYYEVRGGPRARRPWG